MLDLMAFKATDVPTKNMMDVKKVSGRDYRYEVLDLEDRLRCINSGSFDRFNYFISPATLSEGDKVYFNAKIQVYAEEPISDVIIGSRLNIGYAIDEEEYPIGQPTRFKGIYIASNNSSSVGIFMRHYSSSELNNHYIDLYKDAVFINLTETFGEGNEPTVSQMDTLLEQYPSGFQGTKNLFNADQIMKLYFKEMKEIRNAITSLGGGS